MKLSGTDDATKNDTIVNDERLKSFFESNDERFRKLINEHRQFQLNQRKALFNRALRQTLSQSMVNPVHPGLQAIRTYESTDRTDSSPSSDTPGTQVRNVSRNLPTPRYYVPKRLPKRPTTLRHASFDENTAVILNSPRSPFFNNSFGIKALERRIEEDMRIQSERRKQLGGIQRSISLDVPSSTQNDSLTVTNLNISSSFTHGTKSRPNFLSPPQSRVSNQALTISEAVLLANKKIKDDVDDRNLVRTDPKDPRPPLKRQNKVVAEQKVGDEDSVDQSTEETYLSGSDSFFQTELFQDSETKETSCRQSLVSFNDIVEYLSISTENDSFEENWKMAGELQAMFGQYRSDSIEHREDVNYENKMMENEENEYSGAKEINDDKAQNELWGSCARRQRLKDTSWRRLCSDSQDLDIIKTSSKDASAKDSNLSSDIINEEAEPKGDANHKDRVQVQRTRPGEVKRPKKSLILDKIPTQHSLEENGSTPTDLSQNLSPQNLTSASSPMSSKSGSSPLPHSTTSCVSTPSASCVSTPNSISTTSSSNSTGTCGPDCLCHTNSNKKAEREFFNFDRQKTMTLGTHEVRVMSPTTSEDQHTYSTDQKSSTSSCGQTSAHRDDDRPAELDTKSRTKSRKIKRVPFNLARISTDSVDEVFTPRNFGKDKEQSSTENGELHPIGKKFQQSRKSKQRRASVKLGNHRVTIESPTSSEGDNTSRQGTDEDHASAKSSLSESDGAKHKISVVSSCEWLTDNEGYYEDSLNIDKLEDKYKLERITQQKQLRMSQSFNDGGPRLSKSNSLKKFNSEGDICDISSCDRKKSKMTIVELYETEKNYTSNLLTILEVFAEPLKEMGLLAKKTHSILFPNQLIRLVYQHSVFLGRLEERLNNWHHVQKIGDLFSGFKEDTKGGLFKVYLSYITHFPLLFEKLSKMSTTNERFRHYIQKCRQEVAACQRLSLLSLLYNPIQRLPQYLMLLKTYSKHLDPQHADCDPVHSATTSLQTLLFMANKLCNFRKEGPGTIKLPPTSAQDPQQSSERKSSDSVMSVSPDSTSPDRNNNHQAVERKATHHRKLSTLLNVLTFSSVIKKRKKDREKTANSSSCVSCSYTD